MPVEADERDHVFRLDGPEGRGYTCKVSDRLPEKLNRTAPLACPELNSLRQRQFG